MSTFNAVSDQFKKTAEQAQEALKDAMPQVKFNKNGYEIRTQVLDMAKQFTEFTYSSKFAGWEQSVERDEKTGQVVTKVAMPEVPGVDEVLSAAEKFYNFVNNAGK